jgi:antitoxin (DNA-binding transcriptional repressor) of toxin-antitoxin stability system
MTYVTTAELAADGERLVARALAGERIVVVRDGEPAAEIVPLRKPPAWLERWRDLPPIDPDEFRADIDAAFDSRL